MDALLEAERTLLGFERAPVQAVLDACGWRPDRVVHYCQWCGVTRPPLSVDCEACRGRRLPWELVVRLGAYEHPLAQWICEIKYGRWDAMAHTLGGLLAERVRIRAVLGGCSPSLVVPVPMPPVRRFIRGIDHARCLGKATARRLEVPIASPLAQSAGRPQASRVASDRRRRASPFRARWASRRLDGQTVLLIDDVKTSGRTALSAARALRRCGAGRIILGLLAVSHGA